MSPVTVFFRTLLKSSAIFIGAATIFLNPRLEWRLGTQASGSAPRGTAVETAQGGREATVDALVVALKDSDAGVRRQAARALAELNNRRAVPALAAAMKDADPELRSVIVSALGELGDSRGVPALRDALKDESVTIRSRRRARRDRRSRRSRRADRRREGQEPRRPQARDRGAWRDRRRRALDTLTGAEGRGRVDPPQRGDGHRRNRRRTRLALHPHPHPHPNRTAPESRTPNPNPNPRVRLPDARGDADSHGARQHGGADEGAGPSWWCCSRRRRRRRRRPPPAGSRPDPCRERARRATCARWAAPRRRCFQN